MKRLPGIFTALGLIAAGMLGTSRPASIKDNTAVISVAPQSETSTKKYRPSNTPGLFRSGGSGVSPKDYGQYLQRNGLQKWIVKN